jgi:glycosyltransferase involved in cell wall biosynthesis
MYGDTCLIATYHDLVDINTIHAHRDIEKIVSHRVIWVGNSKWGERQGKNDHKGFWGVIMPLTKLLSDKSTTFKIIDSSRERLQHREVLEELSKSSMLLHPSKSEGTGLPVLEAALLGCFPITTNVGIAQELLQGEFSFLIVERDIKKFEKVVFLVNELGYLERLNLIRRAEVFLKEINDERIPRNLISNKTTYPLHLNLLERILLLMRWSYRFHLSRRR